MAQAIPRISTSRTNRPPTGHQLDTPTGPLLVQPNVDTLDSSFQPIQPVLYSALSMGSSPRLAEGKPILEMAIMATVPSPSPKHPFLHCHCISYHPPSSLKDFLSASSTPSCPHSLSASRHLHSHHSADHLLISAAIAAPSLLHGCFPPPLPTVSDIFATFGLLPPIQPHSSSIV